MKNHIDICEIRFQTISGANPRKSIFGELAPSKFKTTIGHLNDKTLRWQVQHEKKNQNCDGRLFAAIRKGKKQNKPLKNRITQKLNCAVIAAICSGETKNVHPPNKYLETFKFLAKFEHIGKM